MTSFFTEFFLFMHRLPRRFVLAAIRFYQKTLSFDHGPLKVLYPNGYCRFHPTCSEYSYQAIKKYGLVRGGGLTVRRLVHCHPWYPGGFDPVR